MQTGWVLQHCYMPAAVSVQPSPGPILNSLLPPTTFPSPSLAPRKDNATSTLEAQESLYQQDKFTTPTVPDLEPVKLSSCTSSNNLTHENSTHFLDPASLHPSPPLQT